MRTRQAVDEAPRESIARDALSQAISAPRIVIERVQPAIDGGRYPARAVVGQTLAIEADIYSDGHPQLGARVLWQPPAGAAQSLPMQELGNDRWRARTVAGSCGVHRFSIEAWVDDWATYQRDLQARAAAAAVTPADVLDGLALLRRAIAQAATAADREALQALADPVETQPTAAATALLLSAPTQSAMQAVPLLRFVVRHGPAYAVRVERERAAFASWYELFPRSQAPDGRHGTLDDVIARLPTIAAMGFDVLYLPPIHPIGERLRKGRNNSLRAAPGDPGSPYAIGSADGGHDAVHPQLGGLPALRRLRDAAQSYGMELALDFAIQCSLDHPWLQQHPGWFSWRGDGSIRCAENPPKRYEDIVNVDFYAPDALPALWLALRDVVEFWIGEGIRSFRVDNPHTKPLPFWEWLIADIQSRHHDVLFLSEAFTRPAMMQRLAKIGFSQSYTYFTWRETQAELTAYLEELTRPPLCDYFRPHFFVNTPDILPRFLQTSGRPGFVIRAALAATLSGLWGVYSGFELAEAAALPGREEYLDSEKYQIKPRDWTAPGNLIAEITRLNELRRRYRALQTGAGLRFQHCDNPQILCYRRRSEAELLLIAVSLDPQHPQETWFDLPLDDLQAGPDDDIDAEELISRQVLRWRGPRQHWRFVPQEMPFAIWRLQRRVSLP